MKKKRYEKPTMKVVMLQHRTQLLSASLQDYQWNNYDED